MPKHAAMKCALVLLLLCLLLAALPVSAQEGAPEAESAAAAEQAAPGITTLVLLLGLGGVALVGLVTMMRENVNGGSRTG
jgi:hypothetical protein